MDISKALDVLEKSVKDLRFDYEQFFIGETRMEPAKKRTEIKRILLRMTSTHITNTGQKFRMLSLQATFNSYQRMWDRVLYQIEMGTYKPHILKAEREAEWREEQKVKRSDWEQKLRDRADSGTRSLYNQYMKAREQTNAPGKVSFEGFKSSLEKQRPMLKKKFGGEIGFKITVEDGKVKVKGVKQS